MVEFTHQFMSSGISIVTKKPDTYGMIEHQLEEINSFEKLANQTHVEYGVLRGSSVENYFKVYKN